MQTLELLHENLDIIFAAVHGDPDSSLIEESGRKEDNDYYALYELNDELFLFHFSRSALCRLMVFENVPSALAHLRRITKS